MEGIKRLFNFGLGGAIGTAIGVVVGSLLAPQSGKELQQSTQRFVDEVKAGGDAAQAETEAQVRARYRSRVGDPTALTETPAKV